jgi:hypothetical protein
MEDAMMKGLFALLLAGTFMIPPVNPAFGNDSTVGLGSDRSSQLESETWSGLPLPPVPHLDTMPWLSSRAAGTGTKFDNLSWPQSMLRPFPVQPEMAPPPFSLSGIAVPF